MSETTKTKCIIVMDRSGSMASCAKIAVEGYNEHVDEFQEQAKTQDIEVCLVTFNGQVFEHFWNEKPESLQKASLESFKPTGSTSLYAAMGYCIDKAMAEDDGKTAYWLVVITDGEENSSAQCCSGQYGGSHDPAIIAELLQGIEGTNRWTISYIGASKTDILQARQQFGLTSAANYAVWSNTEEGAKKMMASNKNAAKKYFRARSRGQSMIDDLYSDEIPICADGIADFDSVVSLSSTAAHYTPNVGTADVFGEAKYVVDNTYKRPQK